MAKKKEADEPDFNTELFGAMLALEDATADLEAPPEPLSARERLQAIPVGESILVTEKAQIAYLRNWASALNCGGGNFRFKTRTLSNGSVRIWRVA